MKQSDFPQGNPYTTIIGKFNYTALFMHHYIYSRKFNNLAIYIHISTSPLFKSTSFHRNQHFWFMKKSITWNKPLHVFFLFSPCRLPPPPLNLPLQKLVSFWLGAGDDWLIILETAHSSLNAYNDTYGEQGK